MFNIYGSACVIRVEIRIAKKKKNVQPASIGPHVVVVMAETNQGRRYEDISATATPAPVVSCIYSL